MDDIQRRIDARRSQLQRSQRQWTQRVPQEHPRPSYGPPPQGSALGGLAQKFITWARQAGVRPVPITDTSGGGRFFGRSKPLMGWVLATKSTPLTTDPNFVHPGEYRTSYAVTQDGRIAWHPFHAGTTPPGSISHLVPPAGSNAGAEETISLIVEFIALANSSVTWPG